MTLAMNDHGAVRVGLVGVGKMGVSHLAIGSAQPDLDVVAVCDSQNFVLAGLRSQIDIETYKDLATMIDEASLDALIVATPTSSHVTIAETAAEHGLHLMVEKPLTLSAADSRRLADKATSSGVVNQVGYHNRFIGTFQETARLVAAGAIGEVHHVDGRAFGQVVTTAQGGGKTWRAKKSEGGGCLHDYACHVIDLMNFVYQRPSEVIGANLSQVYSTKVEDAVHAMFRYPGGATGTLETNWSDQSFRKMTTSITVYGSHGKIYADRQECRLFLNPDHRFEDFDEGWTIRYITELQEPVNFYLRGEEYSAQMDAFANAIAGRAATNACSFSDAADADWVVEEIERVHREGPAASTPVAGTAPAAPKTPAEALDRLKEFAATVPGHLSKLAETVAQRVKEARK